MKNIKTTWWREYRKRIYKTNVRNISVEVILRKIFKKTLEDYVENCSLAGVRQMCDSKICSKERLVRIVLFWVMFGSIFYFLQFLWFDNLAKPLIVTMESSTYPIANIEFPAVTVCNFNRISKKALQIYVRKHYRELAKNNESLEDVEWFCKQLGRLVDYSYNKSMQIDPLLFSFANHLGDSHNIVELMEELAPPCEEMLLRCAWSGELVDCQSIFSVRSTVRGHCCAFNFVLRYKSSGRLDKSIYTIKRQHEPGQVLGLNVILDPMVDDYTHALYSMYGFEVLIFDPTHFADPTGGRVIQRTVQPNQAVFFEVKSIKQVATKEVRKYPVRTRKCRFRDELRSIYNDMYSYSACIMSCRIKTVQSLCKCTPYYMPQREGPVCTLDDLRCLHKYKEKLFYLYPKDAENTEGLEAELQDALYCLECLPDCELTQHFTKHSKVPLTYLTDLNKNFEHIFLKDLNMTNKCLLSIYQATTDGVLNRLDIVFYWFEIVSNVGGFCGILVGFSIISLLEFLYFFVIRFSLNLFNIYFTTQ